MNFYALRLQILQLEAPIRRPLLLLSHWTDVQFSCIRRWCSLAQDASSKRFATSSLFSLEKSANRWAESLPLSQLHVIVCSAPQVPEVPRRGLKTVMQHVGLASFTALHSVQAFRFAVFTFFSFSWQRNKLHEYFTSPFRSTAVYLFENTAILLQSFLTWSLKQ